MENTIRDVTMLVISESGVGKSLLGDAILQNDDAFEIDSSPESCTYLTSEQNSIINGTRRHYIDTQGILSPEGLDAEFIQQMVEFLKNWELGINAFYILINIQNPRFDLSIQRMIQLINNFFNEPIFWNQTGIVFTRCYEKHFNRNVAETKYRKRVYDFIKTLPGCENIDPQLPCFFVDSAEWKNDNSTKNELIRIFEFAHKFDPLPTQKLQITRPEYKSKEKEVLENQLTSVEYKGEGANKIKIFYYENQERYKITDWDDNIKYTDYIPIKKWNVIKKSRIEQETKTETEDKPYAFACIHTRYYRIKTDYIRDVIIDPDGEVSRTEWKPKHVIQEKRIKQKVHPFDDWSTGTEEFWY